MKREKGKNNHGEEKREEDREWREQKASPNIDQNEHERRILFESFVL